MPGQWSANSDLAPDRTIRDALSGGRMPGWCAMHYCFGRCRSMGCSNGNAEPYSAQKSSLHSTCLEGQCSKIRYDSLLQFICLQGQLL